MNIFERATKMKLRFDGMNGSLSVEDLWDLPLESKNGRANSLDALAVKLYSQIQTSPEVKSFVKEAKDCFNVDKLKFDIAKYIIDKKMEERKASEERALNSAKKAKILELIEQKDSEDLGNMTKEQLQEILNKM